MRKIIIGLLVLSTVVLISAAALSPSSCEGEPREPEVIKTDMKKLSINYSPYTNGLSPERNSPVSLELIESHLDILKPYADTIRLFGVSGELTKLYKPAKEKYGFRIIASCWFDKNYTEKQIYKELDELIKLANKGYIDIAAVGSEVLYRRDCSASDLIKYIEYVKKGIKNKAVPVTTSDTLTAWRNPELVEACDIILATIHPFFSDVPAENAADALRSAYAEVEKIAAGKKIIISETGWPTSGSPERSAVPSMENAQKYFEDIYEWSTAENIEIIYFSAFDESWKREGSKNDIGMHWGHFKSDGTLKEAYAGIYGAIAD